MRIPVDMNIRAQGLSITLLIRLGALLAVFCLAVLTTLGVQSSQATYATQDDRYIRIGNDFLEIVLRRDNGGVESVIDKQSRVDLRAIKEGTWPLIWGMSLVTPEGTRAWVDNPRTDSFWASLKPAGDEASIELNWQGLRPENGRRYPTAKVTAKITVRRNSPFSVWSIKVDDPGPAAVVEIHFPLIAGIGILGASGEDDRLVVPDQEGRLFHNPANRLRWWGQTYPSGFLNMQFLAYYDDTAGFFFATRDIKGQTKDFYWNRQGTPRNDALLALSHVFPILPGTSIAVPYDLVVGTFRGDWYTAADLYKEWAYEQWWVQEARTKQTPEWLKMIALGKEFCAHRCTFAPREKSFDEFIQQMRQNQEFFGLPTLGMLWGWEKYGAWFYGDYFPPYEGWEKFDEVVQALHANNSRLNIFIGAWFIETSTGLWRSGMPQPFAMRNADSTIKLAPPWEKDREWAFMDIFTEYWKQELIRTVSTLAEHDVDFVQLDGFPWIEPQDDFSSHGHPLGRGGDWQAQAWLDALRRIRSAARAIKTDIALSGEGGAELYLPYLDIYHSRDSWAEVFDEKVGKQGAEVVPLFEYVYHPYIIFLGQYNLALWVPLGGGSYHPLALARILTWGHIPNYNLQEDLRASSADRRALSYIKAIGTARTTYARKFLVDGAMLRPLVIESPLTTVRAESDKFTGQFPSIQHSVWLSGDGEIGIVLTNIADRDINFTLPLDFDRLGLRAGERYMVRLIGEGGEELLDDNLTSSKSYKLKLQPLQILLVAIVSAKGG